MRGGKEIRGETVTDDLYFIASRLKEIDPLYFIVRLPDGRLTVHHAGQRGDSYALTLPYDRLDARTVEYVMKTAAHRKDQLMKEVERENAQASVKAVAAAAGQGAAAAENLLRRQRCR